MTPNSSDALVREFAAKQQTGVSLRTLLDTGRGAMLDTNELDPNEPPTRIPQPVLSQVARFLHHELPIRLAHRVHELDNPSIAQVAAMPSAKRVRDWYRLSLEEIAKAAPPGESPEAEQAFARVLDRVYERHAAVLHTMAVGVYELRERRRRDAAAGASGDSLFEDADEIHAFLDKFYMSRIGIRMLIGQYLALRELQDEGHTGLIAHACSPLEIAEAAVADARIMCERQHGDAPNVTLHGRLDLTFSYVPTHLHYILLELIKNSMRATVEHHTSEGGFVDRDSMPPIRVVIADGEENEDIAIKVSDEGGGIKRSNMPRVWSYLFTTADPNVQRGFVKQQGGDAAGGESIAQGGAGGVANGALAGLGYGLPISRLYARYFGGELDIKSMEGFGTDAFVHLSRLGNHDEPLP